MRNIKRAELINTILEEARNKGQLPWQSPWFTVRKQNASGHVYTGINRFMVSFRDDVIYMTFNQVKKLGGYVLKGQHGHQVIFYDIKVVDVIDDENNEVKSKKFPLLKVYYVFGLSQVWLPDDVKDAILRKKNLEQRNVNYNLLDVVKSIVGNIEILPTDKAYYAPKSDKIIMPQSFNNEAGFVNTLLHELIHATGHESRLNRFDKISRPAEELVAEIGSVLLANELNLEYEHNNSVAYIQVWMQALEDSKNELFKIIKCAEQAVDYVVETINKVKAA